MKEFLAKTSLWFGTPFFEKHLTVLFYGPRSAGKSLHQAKTLVTVLSYLDTLYMAYPDLPQAIVMSNQVVNRQLEQQYLGTRLFYWESIHQLRRCPRTNCDKPNDVSPKGIPLPYHRLHDAYLFMDDVATIIPADGWADKPMWFRKIFAQAGHNGIHTIGNVQDPESIDINFRRYVDVCVKFSKSFGNRRPERSKPPIRFVWGVYTTRSVGAEELFKKGDMTEEQIQQYLLTHPEMQKNSWRRNWFWIWRKDTEIYDTLQNVPEYMPGAMEHIESKCVDPLCDYVHVRHRPI